MQGLTLHAELQEDRTAIPVLTQPRDTLREGLTTLKEDGAVVHPVEAIQAKASWQLHFKAHTGA